MDLGLGLEDDDIFDIYEERSKKPCVEPYTVRLCPPLWFNDVSVSAVGNTEGQTVLKYRGDVDYQEGKYEEALVSYQRCQDFLLPNNISMKRGVEEDKARCYLRLGDLEQALLCAGNVASVAQNFEQVTDVLQLYLDIYQTANRHTDVLCTLKKLLLLHPNNFGYWIQLGDLYSSIPDKACESNCPSDIRQTVSQELELCNMWNTADIGIQETKRDAVSAGSLTLEGCSDYATANGICQSVVIAESCDCSSSEACPNRCVETKELQRGLARLSSRGNVRCESHSSKEFLKKGYYRLVVCLTCYSAARLLLKSVQHHLKSFAKVQSEQQLLKVWSRLERLRDDLNDGELVTRCSEFLKVGLNLADFDKTNVSATIDDITMHEILCEDEKSQAIFDSKWFSWLLEKTSDNDKQVLIQYIDGLQTFTHK